MYNIDNELGKRLLTLLLESGHGTRGELSVPSLYVLRTLRHFIELYFIEVEEP
jgi:hypothetical protein